MRGVANTVQAIDGDHGRTLKLTQSRLNIQRATSSLGADVGKGSPVLVQMRQTSVKIPCWHWLHMRHNSSATSDELPSSAKTNSTHAVYSDLRPCETASANVVAVPSPPRRCITLQETTAFANRYDTARDIFGGTELQVERHGHVVFQQVLDLIFVYLEPSSAPSSCPVQTLCHAVGGVLFHRTRGADSLSDALACKAPELRAAGKESAYAPFRHSARRGRRS